MAVWSSHFSVEIPAFAISTDKIKFTLWNPKHLSSHIKRLMRLVILCSVCLFSCSQLSDTKFMRNDHPVLAVKKEIVSTQRKDEKSWLYFLQNLPIKNGPILDYRGNQIANQIKHNAIINYDVGTKDLQQCADALMRLRAEYLFQQDRYHEIGFHFVDGMLYTWDQYCNGLKVLPKGNDIKLIKSSPSPYTHESLRKYLDVVYNYASTISLTKELKKTNEFAAGTVVIYPGSPGHCFIIIDEALDENGEKIFKLAEGYTPAQSIYVLSNLVEPEINPWYHLQKGTITTSSCRFINYQLRSFE